MAQVGVLLLVDKAFETSKNIGFELASMKIEEWKYGG